MHQFKLSLFSALSLLYFSTSAQPEQGTTLLGLSSNIGGSSIIGLSYERNEVKSNLASLGIPLIITNSPIMLESK